jgi:hypothetical protein
MHVELDYGGLRIAAREYYEEGWGWRKVRRASKQQLANREEFIRKTLPPRTLADGYYLWIDYLVWLLSTVETLRIETLAASEVEGIRIVSEARAEFARKHPRCYRCGAQNENFAMRCAECQQDFSGKGKS